MSKAKLLLALCFNGVLCQIVLPEVTEESCKTVDGDVGRCVSIESCDSFVSMMQSEPISQDMITLLTAAHCGFEGNNPMVCCPDITFESSSTEDPFSAGTSEDTARSLNLEATFLSPPACGVSNASTGRVVGGVDAKLGDFPWMCLLGYLDRGGYEGVDDVTEWRCGGSLVSRRHVLTAAHCIHNHERDLYVVRLGELDLEQEDEASPVDVLISRKIKHEDYNMGTYSNDIGLLVLERNVDFSDTIMPICLPFLPNMLSNSFVDYSPLVAGWGRTSTGGKSSSHLKMVQLQVVDNRKCGEAYAKYPARIDDSVLCAAAGGRDACEGDSGGALVQPVVRTQNIQLTKASTFNV